MDALANPVGDGWSFDAETATLTLAGATITGDEQGYGIYAVGDLKILLAEGTENTISNIMFAIYVDGSLSISGGQLNILGKTTNCSGIFTIQGFYAQNCTLNVEAELYGIATNGEMQLESCDIQIHVKVLALAGIGLMNISNCTITAISDITVDEYIANGYVDPPCALVCMGIMTITQSNITAAGLTAGIMADMGEQNEIHIDNSYVFSEGTFSGIMARSAITITGSEVIVPVTGDPEMLLSSFDANIPYNGILVMETGPMTITDSSITIDGGPYALGAQILHIRSSVIDISNCIYGIVGLDDLLIEDCEHVHVSTGTIMGDLVLTLGTPIPFAPSAIIPFGCDVIIRNCSDVMADGYVAGIIAPNGKFSLIESNVFAYGGVYGVAGVTASIDDSNVSAHGYWNADQLAAIGQPGQALGIYVLEDITLTSFDVPDAYDIVPDFLSGMGYTFVDFDGNLMADVEVYSTTSPMERDHLEVEGIPTDCCVGDEVSWDSLRVYYVYSDGTRQQLSSSLLEFSEVDTSTPGAKEVTGTYNGMSVTFTLPVHSGFVTQTIAPDLYPESDHMYQHNLDETQTLHWNGARSLTVTFSQETYTEPGCDRIYIYDSNGNEIACYSGGEAAGQTLTIPGDTIHIRMYTDGSVTYFGYSFDSITAELLDHTGDVVEDGHEPTCTEPGRNPMILCDICGIHADGNPYAPELGHIYESVVTDPTPDANGYTTHTCTRCGDSFTDSITIYGAIDNGICGENAQWMLTEDYELVIFGEGAMDDFDWENVPWYEYREQIVSIIVESGITRIGACAFTESHSVTNVTLPDTLESIGVHAFNNCTALESVSIPDSVTLIDIGAFYNCNRLTGLELPDQLRELYDRSFYGCNGLTQVTIPASVVYIHGNPFQYCRNLTEILVEEGNQEFRSVDGVLYDLYRSVLISYPGTKAGHFTVPDTVTVLNNNCFSDADLLTSVDLPEGLYSIGDNAFADCDSLQSIRIPESVERYGYGIFLGCISLNDVTLPSGLTCIPDAMFRGCTSLESISIPDSVTEIRSYAFNGCGLTSLELPDGLIQIRELAFENCHSLTHLTIPASVTYIGSCGFAGCENLTSIEFLGDAPVIEYDSFINVNATIAVPEDNDTWNGDTMQSYGGNLNWVVRGEIVDLELRSVPDNTFLLVGEELDLKGIEVYVTYDNGTGEVLSPELLTLEVDTSEPGCQIATVSYGGFSASFEIIVHGGTRVELDPSEYPESEHYYPDHLEDTQTVTIPG